MPTLFQISEDLAIRDATELSVRREPTANTVAYRSVEFTFQLDQTKAN